MFVQSLNKWNYVLTLYVAVIQHNIFIIRTTQLDHCNQIITQINKSYLQTPLTQPIQPKTHSYLTFSSKPKCPSTPHHHLHFHPLCFCNKHYSKRVDIIYHNLLQIHSRLSLSSAHQPNDNEDDAPKTFHATNTYKYI